MLKEQEGELQGQEVGGAHAEGAGGGVTGAGDRRS